MGHMKDLLITIYNGGDEAVEAAQKLQTLGEWIPVSHRLPETSGDEWLDNVCVLAWSKRDGMDLAWFERDSQYGPRWSWECTRPPTHWMPLPEPPEVK